jgi:hypothetical protein
MVIRMSETSYRIRYRKDNFEVEVQGDKEWVEKKFKELTEGKAVALETTVPKAGVLPTSLVEFIKAKGNPSDHTDIAVIFSYWLHKKEKMSSYNKVDIENCYTEARITKPTNTTDVMNRVQGKGYVMPASEKKDKKKAWVITRSGEEYVEQLK